jgi:carboxylesterase
VGAILALAAAALFGALGAATRKRAARLANESEERLPVGADGIIAGAQPIELDAAHASAPGQARSASPRDNPAVLVLHGGGDTPQTLRYLAAFLNARGYAVEVPLLSGHGRTVRDFARVRADDWIAEARARFRALRQKHDWVGLVGLSMGGALAARVAAETPDLPALCLLAPYVSMPRHVAVAARLAPLWAPLVPYVRSTDGSGQASIHDGVELSRSLAYGVFTPAALRALHATVQFGAAALPRIAAPTLMVQSRSDNRIRAQSGQEAFDRIGAREKELVWLDGAGHVITVDFGRERVFELVADWLERHHRPERAIA